MTQLRKIAWPSIAVLLVLGAGCARDAGEEAAPAAQPEPAPAVEPTPITAVAVLEPRADVEASGTVLFTQTNGTVQIEASVTGASEGDHGLHIHAVGDCSAEDFTSAGGHFNPTDVPHGGPQDAERHAGDLGNIAIGADGTGSLTLSSDLITLAAGAANSIVGKGVILHEGADDLVSQPTGAAGGRLACGVIALEGGGGE